jgi:Polyketide cyclase / dehydrase and lipid transport
LGRRFARGFDIRANFGTSWRSAGPRRRTRAGRDGVHVLAATAYTCWPRGSTRAGRAHRRRDKIACVTERIEVQRTIQAPAAEIFSVLSDPQGHVAIDSTGMLQDAEGEPVKAAGDSFVVHMDREALNDFPQMGKYDVTVTIRDFEADRLISWTILGQIRPQIGHVYGYRLEPAADGKGTVVTSFYDWSDIAPQWREAKIFPIISEAALRATLGILDRTVRRGYPRGVRLL